MIKQQPNKFLLSWHVPSWFFIRFLQHMYVKTYISFSYVKVFYFLTSKCRLHWPMAADRSCLRTLKSSEFLSARMELWLQRSPKWKGILCILLQTH